MLAHKSDDGREQSIKAHLYGSAKLAGEFAEQFNSKEFAYNCGLLHDIGKYSTEFQNRLNGSKKCDHSSAGAKEAFRDQQFGKIAAQCIAGHHSGLLNTGTIIDCKGSGTFYSRLSSDNKIPDYSKFSCDIDISKVKFPPPALKPTRDMGFTFSFFTRMMYSCLVDADFIDTEAFMLNGLPRNSENIDFKFLKESLDKKLSSFKGGNIINDSRCEILNECINKADMPKGLFTLTVPTGAGKTLSSMAFALNHVIKNNQRRIIYVIPYTSIIEQNAKVFSDILGNQNILEHHSNYEFNDNDEIKKKLASENYDIPIVITTNVQFFESFFANKSSRCRKLHNISNSIIIFDEAQMFPANYLKPCIHVITELVKNYNCSAVLCSATQPSLNGFFEKNDIKPVEICSDINRMNNIFKRTDIVDIGETSNQDLKEKLAQHNQVLCIVNSRRHASDLYFEEEGVYHLSTLMCPEHRRTVIEEIRQRLREKKRCIVISTQLIECGVDVDFPVVYRASCGLDSLIQSAGRCNREGKLCNKNGEKINGTVYWFKPEKKYFDKLPSSLLYPIQITQEVIRNHSDLSSNEAIKDYFDKLYSYKGEDRTDCKNIVKELNDGMSIKSNDVNNWFNFDFKTISSKFKIIEENTYSIIIPYNDEAKKLISNLNYIDSFKNTLRKLQQYTVNVYEGEYKKLLGAGKINTFSEKSAILNSYEDYDSKKGLNIDFSNGIAVFM